MKEEKLPSSWTSASMEDLLIFMLGGDWGKAPNFDNPDYTDVLCIRASEMKNWNEEKGKTAAKRKIKKSSLASRELKLNDIILEISGGGPEQPVGRTVLIDQSVLSQNSSIPKICTNFFRLMRFSDKASPEYLNNFFQYFYKLGGTLSYQAGSNNLRNLKVPQYITIGVPLPPLPEQHRIVAKIEELFSELDQGIESLKTAQQQLKIYRQAVLKYAFEGKLTADWRKQQQQAGALESAETLLETIKIERENRYQQQLEEWKQSVKAWEENGKEGKKPGKPRKEKEIPSVKSEEIKSFKKVPQTWVWIRYGNMCQQIKNGISKKPSADFQTGEKIFRIGAVRPFNINYSDVRYISNDEKQYDSYFLSKNDILFTRYNGSRRYVGVCALFNVEEKFLYPDKIVRTKLISEEIFNPLYFVYAVNSGSSRKFIESRIRTTAGQSGVSGGDIKSIPVALCSIAEQTKIVQEIESRFSICDQLEATITENLQKSEALRQSILKQAFEGKLVPQDPNDESAEKLLERIREEKAKLKKQTKQLKLELQ